MPTVMPIVFTSGMDQRENTIVGQPSLERLVNARYVEPSQLAMAPGYYYDPGFPHSGNWRYRSCFQVGSNQVMVSSDGTKFQSALRTDEATVLQHPVDIPAVEAPSRVDFYPSIQSNGEVTYLEQWVMPISNNKWMMYVRAQQGGAYYYYVAQFRDSELVTFGKDPIANVISALLVNDYYSNIGYRVWVEPNAGKAIRAETFSFTTQDWARVLSGPDLSDPFTIKDACITVYGGHTYLVVLPNEFERVDVYDISARQYLRSIDVSSGGPSSIGISAWSYYVVRIATGGLVQMFNILTGLPRTWNGYLGLVGKTPTGTGQIGQCPRIINTGGGDPDVSLGVSWGYIDPTGVHCFEHTVLRTPFDINGQLVVHKVINIMHATLVGRPVYSYNGSEESWFVPVVDDAPVSRTYSVRYTQSSIFTPAMIAHLTMGATGEIPLPSQQPARTGGAIAISISDPLSGALRPAMVFPFVSIASGNPASGSCKLAASALVVGADAVQNDMSLLIKGFEGLRPIPIDPLSALVPAGSPWIDGVMPCSPGFSIAGPTPVVVPHAGAGFFTSGSVYGYILVAECRDAAGNLYRSAPTFPVQITLASTSDHISVSFSWPPSAPMSPGLVRVFRTQANGYVYYDTGLTYDFNSSGPSIVTLQDSLSDAGLLAFGTSGILYSQGTTYSNGLKPKWGPPPFRFGCRGKERILIAGLEKRNRVRWSQTFFPGEGIAFANPSETGWYQDFPEAVTAVATMDDAWIVFSRSKIWVVYGSGPDDDGKNGQFDAPRLVSANIGAITWRSLAELKDGLVFQAADSQIYLLTRGQYSVTWLSSAMKDELYRGLSGTRLQNPIVASVPHGSKSTIHFLRAPLPGDVSAPIIYDYLRDSWSMDTDGLSEGMLGCIGGAALSVPSTSGAAGQLYPTVCALTPWVLMAEWCGNGANGHSPGGEDWIALLETNDISPFNLGGWGKFDRVGLIGYSVSNTEADVSIWLNRGQGAPDQTSHMPLTNSIGPDYPQLMWAPQNNKGSAIRVRATWTDPGMFPSAIVLSVDASQRGERTMTTRRT
jgi:hypothetical protein